MIALLGYPPHYTAAAIAAVIAVGFAIAGRTRSDAPKGAAQRSTTEPDPRIDR